MYVILKSHIILKGELSMKRIVSLLLVSLMLLTACVITGCSGSGASLKLGLGVAVSVSATDATADKAGQGQATVTAAAVLVDANGKIVRAFIDVADNKVGFTADGKAVAADSFATKYEQGKDYGMVAYGGASKEWYEQADAFCALIVGKTASEVKALVAEDYKGTEEVVNAGCTIYVSDFAIAVEKAIANAVDSKASEKDTLKLGISVAQTTADATADKDGSNKVETTLVAAAVAADGKVTAAQSDCVDVSFTFDTAGKSTFDASKAVQTKREQGTNYGMVAYGGAAKEWFEQAAAFDAAIIGKTASEIGAMADAEGKAPADLQAAGCTIAVTGFTKAGAKLG